MGFREWFGDSFRKCFREWFGKWFRKCLRNGLWNCLGNGSVIDLENGLGNIFGEWFRDWFGQV